MKRYAILALAVFLSVFAFFPVDAQARAREEFHETFTVDPGTKLDVKNVNGDISISAWDENYVDVFAVKTTRRDRAELERVTIDITVNDVMSIDTVFERVRSDDNTFFKRMFGSMRLRSPQVSVEYTIKIPESMEVGNARSTNGSVNLRGTCGSARLNSTNGNIVGEDLEGRVEAHTTNGNIIMSGVAVITRARTTNGGLDVSVPRDCREDMTFSTTNGSIKLYIFPDTNADIDLKTTNGRINAEGIRMTMNSMSRNHISGVLGDGGGLVTVKTTNGSISMYTR